MLVREGLIDNGVKGVQITAIKKCLLKYRRITIGVRKFLSDKGLYNCGHYRGAYTITENSNPIPA